LIESEKPLTIAEAEEKIKDIFHVTEFSLHFVANNVLHQLTHQRLHADLYILELPTVEEKEERPPIFDESRKEIWVKESDLDHYALPRLLEKLLVKIKHYDNTR
jgi:adenine-specific DNA glycosylase